MIKEKPSANVDVGLSFLVEMLLSHLVEMSVGQIVVGYSVDYEDLILLDMDRIQGRLEEKQALQADISEAIYNRSQLTFEFVVKSPIGQRHYLRVSKDIKPVYTDKSTGLDDHFTPCDIINANFAVFPKLYSASFFYDYAPGRADIDFAVNQLNHRIVREGDGWEVYKAIQLKCMLCEDISFLSSAVRISHSNSSRIHGVQVLGTDRIRKYYSLIG